MKTIFTLILMLYLGPLSAQSPSPGVITTDIDNFWDAHDRFKLATDSLQQADILQRYYLDRASPGLRAFMEVKGYTLADYLRLLRAYPRFWQSIRQGSIEVSAMEKSMAPQLKRLKELYPALRPASIYFTIGAMRSGGTTQGDKVLIGAELVSGNPATDISEFPPRTMQWLKGYFATIPAKNLVLLNVHEYVHTQQKTGAKTLLAQSIYEGACDFLAELVTGKTMPLPYMDYGPKNLVQLKTEFRDQMKDTNWDRWLYNSNAPGQRPGDLGYYIGYAICRDYYKKARDKKLAVAQMIELDYGNGAAVDNFLAKSGFFGN